MKRFGMILFAFTVLVSGCGAIRAYNARREYLTAKVTTHTYDKSIQEVWPEVRSILFEAGYQVRPGSDKYTVETGWKRDIGSNRSRVLAQGIALGRGKCRVSIMKTEQLGTFSPGPAKRDWELEWKLLQRVNPNKSKVLSDEADVRGRKAAAGQ